MKSFDIAVIGTGPAGYTAALEAAALKKSVVCIERDAIGGTCLNRGCIPTKAMIESALAFQKIKNAQAYGIEVSIISADFSKIRQRAETAVIQLKKGIEFLLKKANVESIAGEAKIMDDNVVSVRLSNGEYEQIKVEKILIATGAKPKKFPPTFDSDDRILTSREALKLSAPPKSAVIIGGGAIGVEFAWLWNSFGTKVTLVELEKNLLPGADAEISKALERSLKKQGIFIKTGFRAEKISRGDNSVIVKISDPQANAETIESEYALWACGMDADAETLFETQTMPEQIKGGFLKVNADFKTSLENIYAVGDITGAPMLAHAAITKARCAVASIFKGEKIMAGTIPSCIYSSPQAASAGVSENSDTLVSVKIPYIANGKAVASGKTEGFLKIVFEKESGQIKGAHILGDSASELISIFVVAIDACLTFRELSNMTFPHPTLSELIVDAVRNIR